MHCSTGACEQWSHKGWLLFHIDTILSELYLPEKAMGIAQDSCAAAWLPGYPARRGHISPTFRVRIIPCLVGETQGYVVTTASYDRPLCSTVAFRVSDCLMFTCYQNSQTLASWGTCSLPRTMELAMIFLVQQDSFCPQ